MKSALVVAHGDDESLFFGGLVLAQPGDWTVICCSVPRVDPIRAWKFFKACDVLGARGQLLPFEEPSPSEPFHPELLALLDLGGYDRIVTHGAEGGYGHLHHRALSHFVHGKYPGKPVWSDCPPGKSDYDCEIRLDAEQLQRKRAALQCYDHVLPYVTRDGRSVSWTKHEALIDRYCYDGGWDLGLERYRVRNPGSNPGQG